MKEVIREALTDEERGAIVAESKPLPTWVWLMLTQFIMAIVLLIWRFA